MTKIYMGGASIDENGKAYGGKAGDQTGGEVRETAYKRHRLGWLVYRAYEPGVRLRLAEAMLAACCNDKIGYDQYQRNTLYNAASSVGFNPARVDTDVETDCSALVRVCCAYAGVNLPDFNTSSEPYILEKSGAFKNIRLDAAELIPGDILVTPEKGHTEIITRVIDKAQPTKEVDKLMNVLRRGAKGHEVIVLQALLNMFQGSALVPDGDFGPLTEGALMDFQRAQSLEVDGVAGKNTWTRLLKG